MDLFPTTQISDDRKELLHPLNHAFTFVALGTQIPQLEAQIL